MSTPLRRGRVAAVLLALAALIAAPAIVTAAPDDPATGRVETCVLDSSSGCTVSHGFGEKPTSIVAINSSTAIVSIDTNLTTATTYRIVFKQHNGSNFSTGTTARYYVHYDFNPPDTAPPDTTITSPPLTTTASTDASFAFSSTETGTFECKLDGGAFAVCTSPKAYSGLTEGSHTFEVRAKDAAGNLDPTPATDAWDIDTTAPDTTITSAPPASTEDTAASFEFSSEAGATFECKLDAGAYAACTSPKAYSGLAVGNRVFSVRAKDAVGNTDPTPATHAWEITAPPAPPVLRPSWQSTGEPTLTFSDEFNDTAVDTTKWERGWFGEGLTDNVNSSNDNCYHTSQVSESGGFLHLVAIAQPNFCKGVTRPYTSGMVTTRGKFDQRFGSFEARVCLPDADSNGLIDNFPAWWVNGMASGFGDGEIDLVEGLSGGDTKASLHYVLSGGGEFHGGFTRPSPLLGCNNFGAEWRGSSVTFYWNGTEFWTHEFLSTPSTAQLVLVLNHAVDDSHSPTVVPPGGNDMTVDWVRVWS